MTIMNRSGLRPLGRAVLCKPYEPETTKSVIEIPTQVRERSVMLETRAIVIEVGPMAWKARHINGVDEPPRAVPGDKVLISKFAGAIVTGHKDGEVYRSVNDDDIYMKIED